MTVEVDDAYSAAQHEQSYKPFGMAWGTDAMFSDTSSSVMTVTQQAVGVAKQGDIG